MPKLNKAAQKKLQFKAEILRKLNDLQMSEAAGGAPICRPSDCCCPGTIGGTEACPGCPGTC